MPPPRRTGLDGDKRRLRPGLPVALETEQKAAFRAQARMNWSIEMTGCLPFSQDEQQTFLVITAGSGAMTLCQSLRMAASMEWHIMAAIDGAVIGRTLRLLWAEVLTAAMVAILSYSQVCWLSGGGSHSDWSSAKRIWIVRGGRPSAPVKACHRPATQSHTEAPIGQWTNICDRVSGVPSRPAVGAHRLV